MARKDIILNSDESPVLRNGDFVVEGSDTQHVRHLLIAPERSFINRPELGLGIVRFIKRKDNATNRMRLRRQLRAQLELDGYPRHQLTTETLDNILVQLEIDR